MIAPGRDIIVLLGREYLNLTGLGLSVWPINNNNNNNNNNIYLFFPSFNDNKSIAEYRGRMLVVLQ